MIYVHIPFCASKCPYCSFNSFVAPSSLHAGYMRALREQWAFELERFGFEKNSVQTLYFGGGTPSVVAAKLYEPLFADMRPYLVDGCEITVEANPKSATKEWLLAMRSLGANRLSLGVQSLNDEKLKFLGRAHFASDAVETVRTAKAVGFDNISIDLIYATHFDSEEFWAREIDLALSLEVQHISAYALTIEEGTPFEKRKVVPKESEANYRMLVEKLDAAGIKQYEVSNFGSVKSRHNSRYWRHENYAGLGAGAVGFLDSSRFMPLCDVAAYTKEPLKHEQERLSTEDLALELLFLSLRTTDGIAFDRLTAKQRKKADILLEEQKCVLRNGSLCCSDLLIADEIALFLS